MDRAAEWLFDAAMVDRAGYAELTRDLAASSGDRSRRAQSAILCAAWQMFREHGYDAVTMEGLARPAGVSRSSIYSYFRSKRSIFLAIAIAVNSRYQAAVRRFSDVPCGPARDAQLSTWVSDYFGFLEETYWFTPMWDHVVADDVRLRQEGVRQHRVAWAAFGSHLEVLRGTTSRPGALSEGLIALSMLERVWFYWSLAGAPVPRSRLVGDVTSVLLAMIEQAGGAEPRLSSR